MSNSNSNPNDETWQRLKAQMNENQLEPAEYTEVDELALDIITNQNYSPAPISATPGPTLRYPDAQIGQLVSEAEEALRKNRAVSAADLYEQALLLLESGRQKASKALLLAGLGRAQNQKGNRAEAETTLGLALDEARRESNSAAEQETRFYLGQLYARQNRLALASDNLRQALNFTRQCEDKANEGRILLELGSTYAGQSMLNKALPCLLLARSLFEDIKLYPDYEERKQADYTIKDQLQEVRKKAGQINAMLGEKQYQGWIADFEAGRLKAE